MKKLFTTCGFMLVLPRLGCTTSPTPVVVAPGPAGQTGSTGQGGTPGQAGATGQTGDRGRPGQTGDQGRDGRAAPCPAGEHRYTNPDNGKVSCVRD